VRKHVIGPWIKYAEAQDAKEGSERNGKANGENARGDCSDREKIQKNAEWVDVAPIEENVSEFHEKEKTKGTEEEYILSHGPLVDAS